MWDTGVYVLWHTCGGQGQCQVLVLTSRSFGTGSLASWPPDSRDASASAFHLTIKALGLQMCALCGFCESKLSSSCLCGQLFTHTATAQALNYFFYKSILFSVFACLAKIQSKKAGQKRSSFLS